MPRIASDYGNDPAKMPFDFADVVAVIAPRAVFVNAPTGDALFPSESVRGCLDTARPVFELFHIGRNLAAVYPQGGHDFPPEARQAAYAFIDRVLQPPQP
jgi:hypothetical protein